MAPQGPLRDAVCGKPPAPFVACLLCEDALAAGADVAAAAPPPLVAAAPQTPAMPRAHARPAEDLPLDAPPRAPPPA